LIDWEQGVGTPPGDVLLEALRLGRVTVVVAQESGDDDMRRRQFLAGFAGTAAMAAGGSLIARPLEPLLPRIELNSEIEATVGYFRRVLAEFDTADWLFGPRFLLPAVGQHLQVIESLLRTAPVAARLDLLRIHARYAEFASWLNLDSGNLTAASYWADRAMDSAQEADYRLMVSYILTKKSALAATTGDTGRALGLASCAQRDGHDSKRVLAVAMQEEAHGHALAGDALACHRKLDDAMHLLLTIQKEVEEEPARYCIPEFLEMWRAGCWMDLGKPKPAIEIFERQLKVLPAVHRRDRGVYLARLASAYAADGQPEATIEVGRASLQIAQATNSGRIFKELQKLEPRLRDWSWSPAVSEFHETLRVAVDTAETGS
jgi:tetratricopeptide (TPR) repeat protein